MSPSHLFTELGAQCAKLCNITNDDALVRKMVFAKIKGVVGWAQQMVADSEAAKREWEETSSTMHLSSGTMLNETEVLVDQPIGKKCRFVSSNLAIDKRETAPRKKAWHEKVWHNVEQN